MKNNKGPIWLLNRPCPLVVPNKLSTLIKHIPDVNLQLTKSYSKMACGLFPSEMQL
jgi:hypothetical protein